MQICLLNVILRANSGELMTDLRSIQRKNFVLRALNHQIGCLNAHLSWSPISTV